MIKSKFPNHRVSSAKQQQRERCSRFVLKLGKNRAAELLCFAKMTKHMRINFVFGLYKCVLVYTRHTVSTHANSYYALGNNQKNFNDGCLVQNMNLFKY